MKAKGRDGRFVQTAFVREGCKICSACGQSKAVDHFTKDKRLSTGLKSACKACVKVRGQQVPTEAKTNACRRWRERHREHLNASVRDYWARNKEEISARRKANYAISPEAYRERSKKFSKRASEAISPGYVAKLLRMPVAEVPQELEDLKRLQVSTHRIVRQLKTAIKESKE